VKTLTSAVLAAAALLCGCSFGSPSTLSTEDLADRASAICMQFQEAVAHAEDPQTLRLAPNAAYLDEIIPSLETAVRDLGALRAHESVADEAEALVGRFEDLLDAEIAGRAAAERGDHAAFARAMGRVIRLSYDMANRASKLGWTGCT
jgi:hypothetical protein